MVKNILIISSDFTGHGHKSITESLKEQFSAYHPDVKIHVIDGFTLGGSAWLKFGKLYGSVTRNAKELWRLLYDISHKRPDLVCEFTEIIIRESFLKILKNVKPDLILSVHPNYNGSILNILEEYHLNIPFVTLLADLVSTAPLWADTRADYILCPTVESKYKCMEFGISEAKTKVFGFPVRARFRKNTNSDQKNTDYDFSKPLECLIMSGGEGSGNMSRVAKILLKNFDCNVSIVAGRNAKMKKRLESSLFEKYGDRVTIYGFMDNIQDLMLASDIAVTRGSPNVAMEVVNCNVPLIITGALPGQEEGNPEYIAKSNLGIVCKDLRKLKGAISDLLQNNAAKLNAIKKSQREFINPNNAKNIVDFVCSIPKVENISYDLPDLKSKLSHFSSISKSMLPLLNNKEMFESIHARTLVKRKKRINKNAIK